MRLNGVELEKELIMNNLIRGVLILSIVSMFVVFIYAQTRTGSTPAVAKTSQEKVENKINIKSYINGNLSIDQQAINSTDPETAQNTNSETTIDDKNDKKLIKKTGLVSAASRGASRGSFSATAYCLKGRTALGHGVRRGIIAADPRFLKLGSTVTINAGPWSGTYLVSDTGGGIKGKEIDIWVPSCSEARKFGRRSVQIFQ